jgi:hypothetical protein
MTEDSVPQLVNCGNKGDGIYLFFSWRDRGKLQNATENKRFWDRNLPISSQANRRKNAAIRLYNYCHFGL